MKVSRAIAEKIVLEVDSGHAAGMTQEEIHVARVGTIAKEIHQVRLEEMEVCAVIVEDFLIDHEVEADIDPLVLLDLVAAEIRKLKMAKVGAYMSVGEVLNSRRDTDRYQFLCDPDGVFLDVVCTSTKDLIATREDHINRHFGEILPVDVAAEMQQAFERLAETRQPQTLTYSIEYSDTDVRNFQATLRQTESNNVMLEVVRKVFSPADAAVKAV